ncbi:MAG TPA: DinB family protein [Chitinophagaceae bacterium]
MKQLLQQYAAYNVWANKRIVETAKFLPQEQINKEIVSSFSSVYKTVLHLMEVENVWWERLKLIEHTTLSGWFSGNFDELSKKLLELSQQWHNWIQNANEVNITHVFAYQNSKNEYFKQPVYEMLLHLFNHQTFHRGQLVTMFRQLGLDKIPPTDFIVFSRKK